MDGIHDLGGMHGFGAVEPEDDEPVFHAPWEPRALALVNLVLGSGVGNTDAFRHAIERMPTRRYLDSSYYERWLSAVETLVVENGVISADDLAAAPGREIRGSSRSDVLASPCDSGGRWEAPATVESASKRETDRPARFAVGDRVRTSAGPRPGHTRLPRYARGRRGRVVDVYPSFVLPDTHAHGEGENAQTVYAVAFEGDELWGADAEGATTVHLDLFEDYLEPIDD